MSTLAPWTYDFVPLHAGAWTIEASYRYCTALASGHYENFPVVFGLMSRPQREALAAVYAFARWADDFADEPPYDGLRERLLDAWEDQLHRCIGGDATHPVFVALGDAMRRNDLPAQLFLDLLSAFRQDCSQRRYATFDEVLDYCRRSANPVGRVVLAILGLRDERLAAWSDRICTALQLTNFWQDLSVDIPRDRLYLPAEDLERFGVPVERVMAREAAPGTADLLRFEVERTARLFEEGRPLITASFHPGCLYFGAVWLGGRAVLGLVEAAGPSLLRERPSLRLAGVVRTLVAVLRVRFQGARAWTR